MWAFREWEDRSWLKMIRRHEPGKRINFAILQNSFPQTTYKTLGMTKTYLLIFTLAGIALITMGVQCRKEYHATPMVIPVYSYAEKVTLTPFKKVYALNDTIWVQFQTTDKTLYDELSGSNLSTDTTFLTVDFDLIREYPAEFNLEDYAEVTVENGLEVSFGPIVAPRDVLTFRTDCGNGPYFFKAGFVLKKTGVFALDPLAMVTPCPDKKIVLPSTFSFTFDLPDCNSDIWQSIEDKSVNGRDSYIGVGIDRKQIFAFKVE